MKKEFSMEEYENKILGQTANAVGKPVEEVRREIQFAIDDAWDRSRGDPKQVQIWNWYFPSGTKPGIGEFLLRMGALEAAGIDPPTFAD